MIKPRPKNLATMRTTRHVANVGICGPPILEADLGPLLKPVGRKSAMELRRKVGGKDGEPVEEETDPRTAFPASNRGRR